MNRTDITPESNMKTTTEDRQGDVAKDEAHSMHIGDAEKPVPSEDQEVRDYTGTARKTDPEEIRLVRKLDWCIMVREGRLDSI